MAYPLTTGGIKGTYGATHKEKEKKSFLAYRGSCRIVLWKITGDIHFGLMSTAHLDKKLIINIRLFDCNLLKE